MRYELYADSLWLLNFVLNLFVCILTNRRLLRSSTPVRLVLAAAAGACCYLLPFVWNAPALLKYGCGILGASVLMLWIAFRPASLPAWRACAVQLALVSFLLGGLLLAALRVVPQAARIAGSMPGLFTAGALAMWLLWGRQRVQERERRDPVCRVTLCCGDRRESVEALVDSGNSLREPISGEPVAVLAQSVFGALARGNEECFAGFRAVPYHSIGKPAGILRAYRIPELRIEYHGCAKTIRGAYAAVSPDETGGVKMILNPRILDEGGA